MSRLNVGGALLTAYMVARRSPDPSTQNGAVVFDDQNLMLSTGCNTFPHGVLNQPDRLDRPQKYHYIEHAERAALYETKMLGLSMVCLWAACADCARTIVASNIHYLYRLRQLTELGMKREEWRDNLVAGDTILEEAGVRVIEVEWESTPKPILFGGETVWLR